MVTKMNDIFFFYLKDTNTNEPIYSCQLTDLSIKKKFNLKSNSKDGKFVLHIKNYKNLFILESIGYCKIELSIADLKKKNKTVVYILPKKPICYLSSANLKNEKYLDIYVNSFYNYRLSIFFYTDLKKKIFETKGKKKIQNFNSLYNPNYNLNWDKSFSLNVMKYLKESGLYTVTIEDEKKNLVCFPFIKSNLHKKKKSKVLLISNLSTWHAYNCWGGISRYRDFYKYPLNGVPDYFSWKRKLKIKFLKFLSILLKTNKKSNLNYEIEILNQKISTVRPMINNWLSTKTSTDKYFDHLSAHEWRGISWLKKNNIDFDLVSDSDLGEIKKKDLTYKCVIISGHAEYWTKKSIKSIVNIIKSSMISFVSLSGNSFYQEVKYFKNNKILFKNNKINEIMPTFKKIYPLYTDTNIKSFSYFKIKKNKLNHWILKNVLNKKKELTSFGKNTLIHHSSIKEKYYYDSSLPNGKKNIKKKFYGSSGWEVDKFVNEYHNFEIIASGRNKGEGAVLAIKEYNKKIIFFVSSMIFIGSLLIDKVASNIVLNLIKKILKKVK